MAIVRLTAEEVEQIQKRSGGKRNTALLAEYRTAFEGENALGVGDWGVIEAGDRNESLKNKRNALAAAAEKGLALEFYRYDAAKGRVPFKVITLDQLNQIKAQRSAKRAGVKVDTGAEAPTPPQARVRVRA